MNTRIDVQSHQGIVADDFYDADAVDDERDLNTVLKSVKNFATLSEALRILGAMIIVASMSVFMLQGWQQGNDIQRYLMLLAQTGLLTAGGFVLSHGLKETKGARIFFGLALISIPANFTILSALLYSIRQWDGGLSSYPEFATWQAVDPSAAAFTLLGALAALTPIAMFCFAIMARRSAIQLSLHFLLINALLLIPIRSSAAIGVVALAGTIYALSAIGRLTKSDKALSTPEGRFALTILFIPIGIILFRSLYFYEADSLLIGMLMTAIYVTLRQISLLSMRREYVPHLLELVSLPVAFIAATSFAVVVEGFLRYEYMAPTFAIVFAAFALDIVRRSTSSSVSAVAGACASIATCLSLVFNVTVFTNPTTAFMCLIGGCVMLLVGRGSADRLATLAGCVTIAAGVVFGLGEMVSMILRSSWVDLAVFGASAIVLGSVLERHGASIQLRLSKWLAGVTPASQQEVM